MSGGFFCRFFGLGVRLRELSGHAILEQWKIRLPILNRPDW